MDRDLRDATAALVRRPSLWGAAAAAGVRHLPRRITRPRSAEPWLRFRMETAYGRERSVPTGGDVVTWLRWVRAWPRARR
ncbi:MAG TPA: hypothetical protein VK507_03160 [Iamia sp.]|nr:hypothetical protein [Iamia sp.]